MGNVFGIDESLALPALYGTSGGTDVSCTSGSETTVITSGAINAVSNGDYYPMVLGVLSIVLGATAPSALVIAGRIGTATDFATFAVATGLLANNAELMIPVVLVGANSGSAWAGSGSTVNVTVKPTGQAVTCKGTGSQLTVALFRGPTA
jgi:hypothetical protein